MNPVSAFRISPAVPRAAFNAPAARVSAAPQPQPPGAAQTERVTALPIRFVRDPLRLTLFLLTLLTVSRVHQHFHFIAAMRPAFLLMLAAAGIVLLSPRAVAGNVLSKVFSCGT